MISLPHGSLHVGDSAEILRSLSTPITYTITSPPYYRQVDYCHEDQLGLEKSVAEYLDGLCEVFSEIYRLTEEGGLCWIAIGETQNNYSPIRKKGQRRIAGEWQQRRNLEPGLPEKSEIGIPFLLAKSLQQIGWVHRRTLIWNKGSSAQVKNSDTAPLTHEYVLQMGKWTKGGRPYFNCKGLQSSLLRYPAVSDPIHPCPFPVLMVREILSSAKRKGVLCDPFAGSGNAGIAALLEEWEFIGCELNPEYAARAVEKLRATA
jgi:DNA modification methylase